MSIFNSLGSNYSWGFAFKNLFAIGSSKDRRQLEEELGRYYGGKATATYKGREALELALRQSGLAKGSIVGINGFTCYALYHAVEKAGYLPLPIDVSPEDLNFGLEELQAAHQADNNLQAIIIQNTLGYPIDMVALENYCQQHNIMLIEDLAHSIGTYYSDNREAGTVGAFTMLSFSQDKPVDAVAGGMLVDRRAKSGSQEDLPLISLWQRYKNRTYPIWTGLIRLLYPLGVGRILHHVLKRLKLLATPMSDDINGLHTMSPSVAKLILKRWNDRLVDINHRQKIAALYRHDLPAELQFPVAYGRSSYLRFPITVEDRPALLNYLKEHGIYIGDTWYDAPIAPKKYMSKTTYQPGMCPEAEALAGHIINLPTHFHITPEKAALICATIKQWPIPLPPEK